MEIQLFNVSSSCKLAFFGEMEEEEREEEVPREKQEKKGGRIKINSG